MRMASTVHPEVDSDRVARRLARPSDRVAIQNRSVIMQTVVRSWKSDRKEGRHMIKPSEPGATIAPQPLYVRIPVRRAA